MIQALALVIAGSLCAAMSLQALNDRDYVGSFLLTTISVGLLVYLLSS